MGDVIKNQRRQLNAKMGGSFGKFFEWDESLKDFYYICKIL